MADIKKSNLNKSEGIPIKNAFVVLIKTEWNAAIVDELEKGCIRKLKESGVKKILSITVPGAVEIPFAAKSFWDNRKKKRPDAFVALGCIIRGGTPHFEYVCKIVAEGVTALNLSLPVPTVFGVLTVENERQARERLGGPFGHRGEDSAMTAIKMIALNRTLQK